MCWEGILSSWGEEFIFYFIFYYLFNIYFHFIKIKIKNSEKCLIEKKCGLKHANDGSENYEVIVQNLMAVFKSHDIFF